MAQTIPACPALLISAIASGQGKTLVTAALARLLARRGRRVRVFKCGPDFLDPLWHELASGAPVHNLDGWMTGEADIRQRLHAAAREADVILIEGVMGLFDGQSSAADLAQLLNVPVLPVVDVGAMAQSIGAIVHGLRHYRPGLRWAGVLGNGVASERHAQMLQGALPQPGDWLGGLPRVPWPAAAGLLPERHLGLVAADELVDARERLDAAADALAQTALGQLPWEGWQPWRVDFPASPAEPALPLLRGKTVAIARDAAFRFIYPANVQTLRELGAQVRFFAPLAGERLPACDAVWLPGGYPELHASALAANTALRADLQRHLQDWKPVWAECGGMLALCDAVVLPDGREQPLWGLLPGTVHMQKRLAGLGMQRLALHGRELRGHTFHYSRLESDAPVMARTSRPDAPADAPAGARSGEAVYRLGSLRASYFHAWFASCPPLAAQLLGAEAAA